MKHPILYRTVIYGAMVAMCITIVCLTTLIDYAPFTSSNMRSAFHNGCNFGARPITPKTIEECDRAADMFKDTLEDLDRQMGQ